MSVNQLNDDFREGEEVPPRGVRGMSILRWVLVLAMGLVAAGSLLSYFGISLGVSGSGSGPADKQYYCPMHPQIVQDHPGECPICSMTLVIKPKGSVKPSASMAPGRPVSESASPAAAAQSKYYCPMHPHITSDDPNAKCALCGGMKLVPRPAEVVGEKATPPAHAAVAGEPVPGLVAVDIPIDRVQKVGIRTARVTRESLGNDFRTVGVVQANERGLAQISPRFSGWIEELFVAETGQMVKRSQVLATIYSPDVLQAQQELLTAIGWGADAKNASPLPHQGRSAPVAVDGMVHDARRRLELLGISPQEIDVIVKRGEPLRAIPIRSPVAGNVITKNAVAGMSVSAGTPLFEIADLSEVWVMADVYEADINRVRVGQNARFEVAAYPGEIFRGKVRFVYPTVDASSRTLRLRLDFKNRPGPGGLKLRPGMYGSVLLDLPATVGLMVPSEALIDTGDVQYVFVAKEHGRFEPRRIKVGARLGERIEVLSGITDGETVVTTANFLVDSESRLRAAVEGQAPSPQGPGAAPGAGSGSPAH